MSKISEYLQNIMDARYGEEVRGSIHDAIEECYDDVSTAKTIADDSATAANTAAASATSAAAAATSAAQHAVVYDSAQALTDAQKGQARNNIGAAFADDVDDLKSALTGPLLDLLKKVAYIDDQGRSYYNALYAALHPNDYPRIKAVFTPGTHSVYEGDNLDTLKPYLDVTYYEDEDSPGTIVSNYTLAGELVEGTQTIIVLYQGSSTSFNVIVTNPFIYRLPNTPVSLDGSTGIDTGIKLLSSDRSFTIATEFVDEKNYYTGTSQGYLFGCYISSSPYTGIFMQVYDGGEPSSGNRLVRHVLRCTPPGTSGGQVIFDSVFPINQLVGHIIRVCFRYDKTSGSVKAVMSVNGTSVTPSVNSISYTYTEIDANLSIGCRIGSTSMSNYMQGTCNDFKVFDYALSDAEMQAYIGGAE